MARPRARKHPGEQASKASKNVAKVLTAEPAGLTAIGFMFAKMNDSTQPPMVRQKYAVKLAPYFHAKLKRAPDPAIAESKAKQVDPALRQFRKQIFSNDY